MSELRRRSLAAALAVATVCLYTSFPVPASDLALLEGRVLAADGATPRDGVVVNLVDMSGRKIFASKPTDERGVFRVDSAPAGTYTLVAEAPEGAFIASDPVELEVGNNPPVSLALKPTAQEGEEEDDEPVMVPPLPAEKGLENWVKWVIAGTIIVGSLAVVDLLGEEEESGSPF